MTGENSPNGLLALLPVLTALIAFLAAIIGGYVAHRYSARRDRESERRKQRTGFLLEAFLLISKSINNRPSKNASDEKGLDLVQIFGSDSEVKLAKQFCEDLAATGDADIYPLLREIRNDLRQQLEMPQLTEEIQWLTLARNDGEAAP